MLNAMKQSVSIPVTAKCRTGIDKIEDYDFLAIFC
jgi:tRNA-dihydrouridine synthase